MPELPEVEVTRRQVAPLLEGRRIAQVVTSRPSYFFLTPPRLLARRLQGRQVVALRRHGKYLLADLDDGCRLLLHLGMTGQLFGAGITNPRLFRVADRAGGHAAGVFAPDEHTHVSFEFEDGGPAVHFRDPRKFGKVQLLGATEASPRLARLGVDALDADPLELWRRTRRRRGPLKSALLDQALLAGVGNIYADEALFGAALRPTRPAAQVSRAGYAALAAEVKRVLRLSIAAGGTSISDFVHPSGGDGAFTASLRVYGRTAAPCVVCATPIRRLVIGGRSSHFCPRCQR